MSILGRLFSSARSELPSISRGDVAYAAAMNESDEMLTRMRNASNSNDPARAVMADLWQQRHNVPFLVTVVETVQEMKSGIEQKPSDQ